MTKKRLLGDMRDLSESLKTTGASTIYNKCNYYKITTKWQNQ
jgi:hypothetical protein